MTAQRHTPSVLLPSGFRDLLPAEAQKEEDAVRRFLDACQALGYKRVRPPLAEFEDALFAEGPGAFVKEQAFRFIDPVSQKMMALRFDITTQIARIVSSRMADAPRPLRLMYANDVVRANASQQRTDRQFRQIGCEIISDENNASDLEIAVTSLIGLEAMGIKALTLDLSYTKLLHLILESYGITGDDKDIWLDMLASKDMAALNARPEAFSQALASVISACGVPSQTIAALKDLSLNDQAMQCVAQLETLSEGLLSALKDLGLDQVQVTIDPFETNGFKYHTGICFTLFTAQANAEIGRGGRYDVQGGQSACGFTIYMDMLLDILPVSEQQKAIFVGAQTSWAQIKTLQTQGWIVHRAIEGYDAPEECTHVFDNGEIVSNKK